MSFQKNNPLMSSPEVTLFSEEELDKYYGGTDSEEVQEIVTDIQSLHDELDASKGKEYYELMNDVGRAERMQQENYRDLMDAITHYECNPGIWTWGDDEEIQEALVDFTRALHNYLAMAMSLRDHTYRVKDKLKKDGFDDDYQEMLRKTGLSSTAPFIYDLRNHVQHRRIPVATGRNNTSVGRNRSTQQSAEVLLDKSGLLEGDKWSDESLDFLDNLDSKFSIRSTVEEHQESTEEFNKWFIEELNTLYGDESQERNEILIEIAELQENLFPGLNEEFLEEET